MAANNLRIVYDNQVDYTVSTITASSTASTSLIAANLKSDVRGLVWRSATHTAFSIPAIFKSTTAIGVSGTHSNLNISCTASSGGTSFAYTLTPAGGSEAANATALPVLSSIPDTSVVASYILRIYNNTSKTTLLDQHTIPVITAVAGQITVVLTNQYHRIPGIVGGATMTGSGTNIIVYDGFTPLRYDGTGTTRGTYRVTTTPNGITAGGISSGGNGGHAIGAAHSTPTITSPSVTYNIIGVSYNNTAINTSSVQSLVLSGTGGDTTHYNTVCDTTISRALLLIENIPTSASAVGMAALNCCNLDKGACMRMWGFNSAISITGNVDSPVLNIGGGTPQFDTGTQLAQPGMSKTQDSWITSGFGTVTYGLDRQIARVYVPPGSQIPCVRLAIEIVDLNNSQNYIEASRLIVGRYWSPTYNTEYGLGVSLVDTSETNRSEAGDLITTMGVVYKTMNFNLNFLTKTDRDELVRILRQRGKRRPMFVSLFPENSDDWDKEVLYQMYCKLSDNVPINHPYFDFFNSSLVLEEV